MPAFKESEPGLQFSKKKTTTTKKPHSFNKIMKSKTGCFIDEMFSRDFDFIINEVFISGTKNTGKEGNQRRG